MCCALLLMLIGTPARAYDHPYFETIAGTEEIGSGIITAITQDRAGLLWLGTVEGLYSYDGYRLRAYRHRRGDPDSLGDDYVRTLLAHSDGRLWVGTDSAGISILDPRSGRFEHHRPRAGDPHALHSLGILSLIEAADGDVWAGSYDRGVARWDASDRRYHAVELQLREADPSFDLTVRCLLFDRSGDLWVGTRNGLQRIRAGANRAERVASQAGVPGSLDGVYVYGLFQASDGRIWIGTQPQGVAVLDSSGRLTRLQEEHNRSSHPWINGFIEPEPGRIWISTYGAGFDVLDASADTIVQRIRSDRSVLGALKLDRLSLPFVDRSGLMWVGTWGAGLQRHNPHGSAALRTVRHSAVSNRGLSMGTVLSSLPVDANLVWLGTGGNGIDLLNLEQGVIGGHRPHPDRPGALRDGTINVLARDFDGSIWVGTQLAGLQRFTPEDGQFSEPVKGLPRTRIESLYAVGDGRLVIGMSSGLVIRDRNAVVRSLRLSNELAYADSVRSVALDRSGRLWALGLNSLVMLAPGAEVLEPVELPETSLRELNRLHVDAEGELWLTGLRALMRLRSWENGQPQFESAEVILATPPPASGFGGDLPEDADGRIWSAARVMDVRGKRVHVLSKADGFDIGANLQRPYSRTASGLFLFGGTEGLVIADPTKFQFWDDQPPLVATELKINGRSQPVALLSDGLQLAPDQENFSIEFAALDYSAPMRNRYAYRLQGHDKDWIETDAEHRSASYGGLWPGQYTLEVRGSGRSGNWSPHLLRIPITVLPAFWQTPWFAVMIGLAVTGFAWSGLRWRTARLSAEAAQLQAVVQARTADIIKLGELGKQLAGSLDLETTLQTLYQQVAAHLDATVFLVGLNRVDRQCIEMSFVQEGEQRLPSFEIPLDQAQRPAVWCVRERRELITNRRAELLNYLTEIPEPQFGVAMQSIVYLPLMFEHQVLGCVSVQSKRESAFDPAAIEFLRSLAGYAAIALANAQSFEQVQVARAETEATLEQLTRTQQQLVQQEKMAALGTLTAGVAHEINNPTNFADGAVQHLVRELENLHEFLVHLAGDDAPPEVLQAIAERFAHLEEMTATAREGHERIKRIVADLRQFTRLDQAEFKSVPIAEPIQSTVNLVRTRFDRVRFELDLAYNPSIECQPAKLGQVFMNLIINACESISECADGREGVIKLSTRPAGSQVRIELRDNGRGMDEATRQRVFEPFFTTKSVGAGTGLGLAIVFGIIKDHGGSIELQSEPGNGSCFLVHLPLRVMHETAP